MHGRYLVIGYTHTLSYAHRLVSVECCTFIVHIGRRHMGTGNKESTGSDIIAHVMVCHCCIPPIGLQRVDAPSACATVKSKINFRLLVQVQKAHSKQHKLGTWGPVRHRYIQRQQQQQQTRQERTTVQQESEGNTELMARRRWWRRWWWMLLLRAGVLRHPVRRVHEPDLARLWRRGRG